MPGYGSPARLPRTRRRSILISEYPQLAAQPPEPPKGRGQPGIAGPVFVIAHPPKAEIEARSKKPAGKTCWNALRPSLLLISGYATAGRFGGPVFRQGSDVDFSGRCGSRFPIHWENTPAVVQNIVRVVLAVDDTERLFQQGRKQMARVPT